MDYQATPLVPLKVLKHLEGKYWSEHFDFPMMISVTSESRGIRGVEFSFHFLRGREDWSIYYVKRKRDNVRDTIEHTHPRHYSRHWHKVGLLSLLVDLLLLSVSLVRSIADTSQLVFSINTRDTFCLLCHSFDKRPRQCVVVQTSSSWHILRLEPSSLSIRTHSVLVL